VPMPTAAPSTAATGLLHRDERLQEPPHGAVVACRRVLQEVLHVVARREAPARAAEHDDAHGRVGAGGRERGGHSAYIAVVKALRLAGRLIWMRSTAPWRSRRMSDMRIGLPCPPCLRGHMPLVPHGRPSRPAELWATPAIGLNSDPEDGLPMRIPRRCVPFLACAVAAPLLLAGVVATTVLAQAPAPDARRDLQVEVPDVPRRERRDEGAGHQLRRQRLGARLLAGRSECGHPQRREGHPDGRLQGQAHGPEIEALTKYVRSFDKTLK